MKNKKNLLKYIFILFVILIIFLVYFKIIKSNTSDYNKSSNVNKEENIINSNKGEQVKYEDKIDDNSIVDESTKKGKEVIQSVYDEMEQNKELIDKINTQEKFKEEKNIDGLRFKNSVLYKEGDVITFLSEFYNGTNEDIEYLEKEAILLDDNSNELGRLKVVVGNVKKNQYCPIVTYTKDVTCDIEIVYDFKII